MTAGRTVGKPGWPFTGTVSPAKLAAAGHVADSRGTIPRQANIPLHIGVVRKQFAVGVKGNVIFVAVT